MKYRVTHPEHRGHAIFKVVGDVIKGVLAVGDQMLCTLPSTYRTTSVYPKLLGWNQALADLKLRGYIVQDELEDTHVMVPELASNEKVALWCRLYKLFKGTAYTMNGKDVGMLTKLPVTDALLTYYLDETNLPENSTTWLWRGKQSIANLTTYFNQVRTAMVVPIAEKSKHPNHWVPEHAKKLDGAGMTEYVRHLKGLGLTVKKDATGSTIDWVKADASTK